MMKRRLPEGLTAYVAAVVMMGTLVIIWSLVRLIGAPPGLPWFLLAGLTILTSAAALRMPVVPISFSISDTFTITAALLFGPEAGALAVAIDTLTISWRLVRRDFPLHRVFFNATAPALAMWVAARMFFWLADVAPLIEHPEVILRSIGPLTAFAATYFVLNTGLIAGAVAGEEHRSVLTVWRLHFLNLWLTFFGGASIAALVILLMASGRADYRLLALVVPLFAVLYLTFKSAVDRMRDEVDQLAHVNRMYHSLVDGAVYGISRATEEGKLLAVNPAIVAMLGYESAHDLLARNLWTDISADANDRQALAPDAESDRIQGMERWWRRKDGSQILVRLSGRIVPADDPKGDASVELMVEDVTTRRALEEQLQQAQKLDAIGRLARGVAHDFNNLLTVIMGSGALIGEGLPPDDPMQADVRQLMNASATAANLTRQLLAFSRQQPNRLVELDVNAVIANLADLLKGMVGKRVTIETSLGSSVPMIHADRSQIEQVIMNLAINARDAMPAGGTLRIATSASTRRSDDDATGDAPASFVRLRIADTGTGMSESVQAHIFEPFFTTKEDGKGTGLGLATVYGVVKQSGGEIAVKSRVGEGTVFTIWLPASTVPVVAAR